MSTSKSDKVNAENGEKSILLVSMPIDTMLNWTQPLTLTRKRMLPMNEPLPTNQISSHERCVTLVILARS